jgi:HK97 family phage major capsid protein
MEYVKNLQEANTRLSVEMNAIVAAAKAESNRGLTSAEAEKFDKLEIAYSANEESVTRAQKADKIASDLREVPKDDILHALSLSSPNSGKEKDGYAKAYNNYLRNGMQALGADEQQMLQQRFQNAPQSTTTGAAGGYTVPTLLEDKIEVAMKFYGGILGNVGELVTSTGGPLNYPTSNDTNNVGQIIGQNTQVTTAAVAFNTVPFSSYIFCSNSVLIPLALLQDSQFPIDDLIAEKLGQRMGRLLNNKLTVGAGTTEPLGIVPAAVAAGLTYVAPTGSTTSLIYDDLVNLEHTVDPAYRPKSKYMFCDLTLKALKKMKDTQNRPLWQAGLTASFQTGAPQTILDHEYVINNDMPVMAANAQSIVFGDLTKYKHRKVAGGITLLRLVERYADFLQVGILGFLRADGNLLDAGTHPIAVFVNSGT